MAWMSDDTLTILSNKPPVYITDPESDDLEKGAELLNLYEDAWGRRGWLRRSWIKAAWEDRKKLRAFRNAMLKLLEKEKLDE
jgi:hypothetical protein